MSTKRVAPIGNAVVGDILEKFVTYDLYRVGPDIPHFRSMIEVARLNFESIEEVDNFISKSPWTKYIVVERLSQSKVIWKTPTVFEN